MYDPKMKWIVSRSSLLSLLCIFLVCGHVSLALGQENVRSRNAVSQSSETWAREKLGAPLARDPIFVYNDWSAYDELSDNIPLTEQLAMKELDEILRLRRFGIRVDYYMMDAFWFAPDGGYRSLAQTELAQWSGGMDQEMPGQRHPARACGLARMSW